MQMTMVRWTQAHIFIRPGGWKGVLAQSCMAVAQAKPALRVDSPMLCRALFEVFLGADSIVPDARSAWAAGARALLSSEQVRRDTRKSGA